MSKSSPKGSASTAAQASATLSTSAREVLWSRDKIVPSKTNPRKRFDEAKLQELAGNIEKHGILQPILCRPLNSNPDCLEIIAGERRYRAAGLAGLEQVPVRVVEVNDLDMLELQIVENLQRQDLHELEEAESYEALLAAHKGDDGYGVDEIAAKVGKSRAYVYARLKLCALGAAAREKFYAGELSASVALYLARIPVPELQDRALEEVLESDWTGEPMSAREAADHIQENYMLDLKRAPFPIVDARLVEQAGACTSCPKRTGANPDLFSDVSNADVCTDPECFSAKRAAHVEQVRAAAVDAGQVVISGAQAKKLIPYEHATPRGYILPAAGCLEAGTHQDSDGDTVCKTYEELLGDKITNKVLIENPHNGQIMTVYPADEVKAALFAMGITHATAPASPSHVDQQREREKKAKAEKTLRREIVRRIHEAARQRLEQSGTLATEDLLLIAQRALRNLSHDCAPVIMDFWAPGKNKTASAGLSIDVNALATYELALLLLDVSLAPYTAVSPWSSDMSMPDDLRAAAARYGINVTAVKREITAGPKAKAKGKNAAKKPAARGKNESANATPEAEPEDSARTEVADATEVAPAIAPWPYPTKESMAARAPETDATDPQAAPEDVQWQPGDRVRVKADARGPNGKRMKVCGRVGTILDYAFRVAQVEFDDGSIHMHVDGHNLERVPAAEVEREAA